MHGANDHLVSSSRSKQRRENCPLTYHDLSVNFEQLTSKLKMICTKAEQLMQSFEVGFRHGSLRVSISNWLSKELLGEKCIKIMFVHNFVIKERLKEILCI
jgi:hypothetical protein